VIEARCGISSTNIMDVELGPIAHVVFDAEVGVVGVRTSWVFSNL
jgi:hypothetical protein